MKKQMLLLIGTMLPFSFAMAAGPSFDCSKAGSNVEKLICADKNLSELDSMFAMAYKSYVESADDKSAAKKQQLAWLKNERNNCNDKICIEKAYEKRFAEIDTRAPRAANGLPVGHEKTMSNPAQAFSANKSIPIEFQGNWGDDKEGCKLLNSGMNNDRVLSIDSTQLKGYGFVCKLSSGEMKSSQFEGDFTCKDEEDNKSKQRKYIMSIRNPLQLSLGIKGSPVTEMMSCKMSTAHQNKPTENKITNSIQNSVPVVRCSTEDQMGMVNPNTGRMSQLSIDIQMGKVRCGDEREIAAQRSISNQNSSARSNQNNRQLSSGQAALAASLSQVNAVIQNASRTNSIQNPACRGAIERFSLYKNRELPAMLAQYEQIGQREEGLNNVALKIKSIDLVQLTNFCS